jgi:hypothetical protein
MNTNMKKTFLGAASTALLLAWGAGANAYLIDDFAKVVGTDGCDAGFADPTQPGGGNGLGSVRAVTCVQTQGTSNAGIINPPVGTLQGLLNLNNEDFSSANLTVVWTPAVAVDLTDAGVSDRFRFDVASVDITSAFSFTLSVDSGTTTWSYTGSNGTFTKIGDGSSTAPFDIFFTEDLADVAALSAADKITLAIVTTKTASDFSIDRLYTTVPEPTTIALLGLGLIGVGVARRRNRQ